MPALSNDPPNAATAARDDAVPSQLKGPPRLAERILQISTGHASLPEHILSGRLARRAGHWSWVGQPPEDATIRRRLAETNAAGLIASRCHFAASLGRSAQPRLGLALKGEMDEVVVPSHRVREIRPVGVGLGHQVVASRVGRVDLT